MGNIDFLFLTILIVLFLIVNFVYKRFPRSNEKLLKLLTDDKI